jgi:CubicO group peptidase (beta-lactamase class C family)/tetratricopeptide (TPR) repeat protein
MRYFIRIFFALYLCASVLHAMEPQNGQQSSSSEKQHVSKQGTQNPEAYELYLKGRTYVDKQTLSDLKTSVTYFNQAIAKDPGYALAYSGLARVYALLPDYGDSPVEDHPKAMALARKALELDPTLSEPHAVLGGQMIYQDWDIAGGVAEFKKAVALDPNNAQVHYRYAVNISIIGGMEQEALAEINRAHQLDPLRPDISVWVGIIYGYARQFDEAIVTCKKVAKENPTFADAHDCLANAYWGKKMYPQVIEEYKAFDQLSHDDFASAMVQGFGSGGWPGALRKCTEDLLAKRKAQPSSAYGTAYQIAGLYAQSDDKEQAFQWLNTALQEHDEGLMGLKTDLTLDPIRSDQRFAELVRKVGLPSTSPEGETLWPTKGWTIASPTSVGIDEQVLLKLDNDMTSGKYSQMIDSFAVFRCGKKVFGRTYPHDYAKIYAKQARERGAYNMRLTGRYNYFDPYWHPYYHGTDLHTMQSISKTVTSVLLGAAIDRGDFKASLDTPVLKYFDSSKVKNVDDRKRRMTLRHLLTMSSGLEWNATDFENSGNPDNDTSRMEASNDWAQYAIDKPMAAEPGKVWNYNDGAPVLLAYIFQKETGWDIDDYGQKFLFAPLGIRHEWKRSYLGVPDTEGGLYLTGSDLAKIGYLYLQGGAWNSQRIVSSQWVKESVTPYFQTDEPQVKYGFSGQWFMSKVPGRTEDVWLSDGYGYQELMVFPEDGLIVTVTGWDVLPNSPGKEPKPLDFLPLVKTKTCSAVPADAAAK